MLKWCLCPAHYVFNLRFPELRGLDVEMTCLALLGLDASALRFALTHRLSQNRSILAVTTVKVRVFHDVTNWKELLSLGYSAPPGILSLDFNRFLQALQ